ncbi:MAG: hypothetical protein ABI882_10870 [Acidobacteriota bacterium]
MSDFLAGLASDPWDLTATLVAFALATLLVVALFFFLSALALVLAGARVKEIFAILEIFLDDFFATVALLALETRPPLNFEVDTFA